MGNGLENIKKFYDVWKLILKIPLFYLGSSASLSISKKRNISIF
jgi:hypothetical protein